MLKTPECVDYVVRRGMSGLYKSSRWRTISFAEQGCSHVGRFRSHTLVVRTQVCFRRKGIIVALQTPLEVAVQYTCEETDGIIRLD